jgi:hypothetical protein
MAGGRVFGTSTDLEALFYNVALSYKTRPDGV